MSSGRYRISCTPDGISTLVSADGDEFELTFGLHLSEFTIAILESSKLVSMT